MLSCKLNVICAEKHATGATLQSTDRLRAKTALCSIVTIARVSYSLDFLLKSATLNSAAMDLM